MPTPPIRARLTQITGQGQIMRINTVGLGALMVAASLTLGGCVIVNVPDREMAWTDEHWVEAGLAADVAAAAAMDAAADEAGVLLPPESVAQAGARAVTVCRPIRSRPIPRTSTGRCTVWRT